MIAEVVRVGATGCLQAARLMLSDGGEAAVMVLNAGTDGTPSVTEWLSSVVLVEIPAAPGWVEARFGETEVFVTEGQYIAIVVWQPNWQYSTFRARMSTREHYPAGALYRRFPAEPWWTLVANVVGTFETDVCRVVVVSVEPTTWGRQKARYRE